MTTIGIIVIVIIAMLAVAGFRSSEQWSESLLPRTTRERLPCARVTRAKRAHRKRAA